MRKKSEPFYVTKERAKCKEAKERKAETRKA